MITAEESEPVVNLDELPITLEQTAWNLRKKGHLVNVNLRDRTKTRPAIYQLLKDGIVKKEDIKDMLIPKPKRQVPRQNYGRDI